MDKTYRFYHSIFFKFLLGSLILAGLFSAFAFKQYQVLNDSQKSIEILYNDHMQGINFIRISKLDLLKVHDKLLSIEFEEGENKESYEVLNEYLVELDENLDIAQERAQDPHAKAILTEIIDFINPLLSKKITEISVVDFKDLRKKIESIDDKVEDAIEFELQDAFEYLVKQGKIHKTFVRELKIAALIIVGFILVLMAYMVFRVLNPLRQLGKYLEQFGEGKLSVDDIKISNNKNEVGLLQCDFKNMAQLIKQHEETIKEHSRKLSEISRRAGKFEVASEMMHNLGNLINSLNVSTLVLSENQQKSLFYQKFSKIIESWDNFHEKIKDKQEQFLEYLTVLQKEYDYENRSNIHEINNIKTFVEHMQYMLSEQNNKNPKETIKEAVDINTLLNECLVLVEPEITKDIKVIKECEKVGKVEADRHGLIQVIVNLLSHSIDSLKSSSNADKKLQVRVSCDDKIRIQIIDNGAGIEAEKITQVFTQGYSGKEAEQGINLHDCANLVARMQGSIKVDSSGVDQGEVFTVSLPIATSSDGVNDNILN